MKNEVIMFSNNAVEIIKNSLSMQDVSEWYGYIPNHAGFIHCPFHDEKTASMKIYSGDRGYYCYGCGESGDVISFVQHLFDLSFKDTLRKIDEDFNLKIFDDKTLSEIRRFQYIQKSYNAKKQRQKRQRELSEIEYWAVFDEWKRLDDNKRKYAPKSSEEELHPLFVEALQKLAYQEHLLDCAETRRWQNERTNNTVNAG